MKMLILFFCLSFLCLNPLFAQELSDGKSKHTFVEWNFGVAFLDDANIPFPGTSVLWGKTYINDTNFIFEYEAGIAFPTLVTAKFGVGKRFNTTNVVVGLRPFPFNVYAQSSFSITKKGYWITSVEFNPLSSNTNFIESKAIFNVGYRWDLTLKRAQSKE